MTDIRVPVASIFNELPTIVGENVESVLPALPGLNRSPQPCVATFAAPLNRAASLDSHSAYSRHALRVFSFLGIHVEALSQQELLRLVAEVISTGERRVIANHNLHSLFLVHHDERMRRFHQTADHTHVDGMSLVILGRIFGAPLAREHRTGYMDFLPHLARAAVQERWRLFYLGSRPGVADRAAALLRARYPGLGIRTRHGYFDACQSSLDNQSVLQEIADYKPHILLVGMGMPRQEAWILENLDHIAAGVILCTGALMDYVSGEIPTPPRWLGQIGLEWLFRVVAEPSRLWRRYLLEPWFIGGLVAKEFRMRLAAKRLSPAQTRRLVDKRSEQGGQTAVPLTPGRNYR